MADSALTIVIRARDEASKTFKSISRDAKQLGDSLSSIGSMATIGITLPLVGLGTAITRLAMNAVESENLFDVSMKGMAASARQWSEATSKSLGLNAYEVRRNVGMLNTMFTSMDLGEKSALDMSEGLTQLAYDMASFYNLKPDEAFEKLRAGITGETEPLKRLGIVVNETTVKQWAFNNGLIAQGQELSEGQKVLARYGLIMQQTSDAQGDMARTIDSPANALRRMKSQFEEIAISAGQTFLPEVSKALGWINQTGIPNVRAALDGFKQSWADMSGEGRKQLLILTAALVAGGPLLMALSYTFKAVVALAVAFKTLRIKALLELAAISLAAYELGYQIGRAFRGQMPDLGEGAKSWSEWVAGLGSGMVELAGGALSLEDAMNPIQEGMHNIGKGVYPPEVEALPPALDLVKSAWDSVGGAAQDAGKDTASAARSMIASTSEIISYLVRMDPASIAAAASVSSLKSEIVAVQGAIAANNDAIRAAQAALAGLQNRASELSEELSKTKSRLEELANIRMPGMNEADEQIFQVEQELKRLKLQAMGFDTSMFAPMNAQARALLGTLPRTSAELEKMLEAMRLQKSLKYDEQLRRIQEAAKGLPAEMPFEEALRQIGETKGRISGLEGDLAGTQAAIKGAQAAIAAMGEAGYELNKQLQVLQEELQGAEGRQDAVNGSLSEAYTWLVEQRPELIKYGAEWLTQVTLVDQETRRLVSLTRQAIEDESNRAIQMINDALLAYRSMRAEIAINGGGGGNIPQYASGVMGARGGWAIVGERGPELINLPRGSDVIPLTGQRQLNAGTPASQVLQIVVNVQGSVTTERELVEAIRTGLIQTAKRNGTAFGGYQ